MRLRILIVALQVRAELDEQRPEVLVHEVHLVVVDHRRRRRQPRVRAAHRVVAALGAHHPRLLLRLADVQHPLRAREPAQVRLGAVVLALETLEPAQIVRNVLQSSAGPDRSLPVGRSVRWPRRSAASSAPSAPTTAPGCRGSCGRSTPRPPRSLQHRHVDVEVHPVDALQLQGGVLGQHFGGGSCVSVRFSRDLLVRTLLRFISAGPMAKGW